MITQDLETATVNAVARALEKLNVPSEAARPLALELIQVASEYGQSIDGHLIPWIRRQRKFSARQKHSHHA